MPEITDDAILETAERLAKELALTEDDREVITLAIQRLVWPPSPHPWMHEGEHIGLSLMRRAQGGGWAGVLACPHGCGRKWTVHQGPSEEAVHGALTQAHEEYRSGRPTAVSPPTRGEHRLSLDDLFGRNEYVEVHDERMPGV